MGFVILADMKKVLFFILLFPSCFIVKHDKIEQKITSNKVDFHCGWTQKLNVIKNQKELNEFIIGKGINGCRNLRNQNIIQDINFNKYTLIGYGSFQSGCNTPTINLSFKKINKIIFIHAAVSINGLCKGYFHSETWHLIPKIKKNEDVNFKVSYIYPDQ